MQARISEIFKSIQGEGIYQGFEQVFVRFFGCNLNCAFCDTSLSYYEEKTLKEVAQTIFAYNDCHSVSLTGGEPLLQIEFLRELAKLLKKEGKIIYLETNGTLYENLKKVIDYVDIIAMDFKLPSSTDLKDFWEEHLEFLKVALRKEVFIKAVIGRNTCQDDILKSIAVIKGLKSSLCFILQPENPYEDVLAEKLEYFQEICVECGINTKVIPQLHKKLGIR